MAADTVVQNISGTSEEVPESSGRAASRRPVS